MESRVDWNEAYADAVGWKGVPKPELESCKRCDELLTPEDGRVFIGTKHMFKFGPLCKNCVREEEDVAYKNRCHICLSPLTPEDGWVILRRNGTTIGDIGPLCRECARKIGA